MKIEELSVDDIIVIRPLGDIRSENLESLREVFERYKDTKKIQIAIDLEQVNLIDSNGLSLLLRLEKQVKAIGGFLYLFNYSSDVKEIIDLVELGSFIPTFSTFNELMSITGGGHGHLSF